MDDEEIDIEGDCTVELTSSENVPLCFDNELPSTSVNLTPEFSQHPWMLEQGWTSDYFIDEKSKAAIEKMLLEEDSFTNDRSSVPMRKRQKTVSESSNDPVHLDQNDHVEYEAIFMDNDGTPTYDAAFPNLLGATTTCVTTPKSDIERSKRKPSRSKAKVHKTKQSTKLSKNMKSVKKGKRESNTVMEHSETVYLKCSKGTDCDDEDEDIIVDIEADDDDFIPLPAKSHLDLLNSASFHTDVAEKAFTLSVEVEQAGAVEAGHVSCDGDLCVTEAAQSDRESHLDVKKETEHHLSFNNSDSETFESAQVKSENRDSQENGQNSESQPGTETVFHRKSSESLSVLSESETESQDADTCGYDDFNDRKNEWGVLTSKGTIVYLPNPTKDLQVTLAGVSEEEKIIHSEFFDGRPGLKNEERYLKIRNYIVNSWAETKPKYLFKTSVRDGLKNCGDVNCIGRIHSYLEQKGAINFGCELAQYNCKRDPVPFRNRAKQVAEKMSLKMRSESINNRKRRVRNHHGDWINEKDLEGMTIKHNGKSETVAVVTKKQRRIKQDPFKLIPCKSFNTFDEPFKVSIEAGVLVIMDIHSHLSKTEIIGLLGGRYDAESRLLQIQCVEPCDSLSTGMQCDMDPVSQAAACEAIHSKCLQVVGWYHSHPTFAPNPSLRDLETQEQYQSWFAQGGGHFVGVIVSPFGSSRSSFQSEITCLSVRQESGETSADSQLPILATCPILKVPYQFQFTVQSDHWNDEQLRLKLSKLISHYEEYPNKVDIQQRFLASMDHTVGDKMIYSAVEHLKDSQGPFSADVYSLLNTVLTRSGTAPQ